MSTSAPTLDFAPVPDVAGDPFTGEEIAGELRRLHAESVRYWSAYEIATFFRRPKPDVWAPADQVRHLTKSIRAVTKGATMPRPVLFLLFGLAGQPSRRIEGLKAHYRQALGRGGKAGRFAPRALEPAEQSVAGRSRLMAQHAEAVESLASAVERWSERALDRYRLPHPLLGKLTVREMMLFTVLHNVHHVHVAERRRREE